MPLAVQYLKGGVLQAQFGLDVEDYRIKDSGTGDLVANQFYAIKDSQDNCYIYCGHTEAYYKPKIIKISNGGIKTVSQCLTNMYVQSEPIQLTLSRDEQTLFYESKFGSPSRNIYSLPVSDLLSETFTPVNILFIGNDGCRFALYQDRYIWGASGTTVKIYDYTTKVELASVTVINSGINCIVCTSGNELYICQYGGDGYWMKKVTFINNDTLIVTNLVSDFTTNPLYYKQLIIDKYGDLICLTNDGAASTLLKYTTEGVQVGTELTLGGAFYNLNTDALGNYYYSNALGSYKIAANTAQGQAFSGLGVLRRGSGMTTYGNNTEGYNPAVFGPQE